VVRLAEDAGTAGDGHFSAKSRWQLTYPRPASNKRPRQSASVERTPQRHPGTVPGWRGQDGSARRSRHLGHAQMGERQLELAYIEDVGAEFAGARVPELLRLVSVALHGVTAVERRR
jgi:hypothetical protein